MPLSPDQAQFVQGVAAQTGIDPRVLIAWGAGEGHPGDLYHNYMNITATTARSLGVPVSGVAAANTAEFPDVQTGIDATVKEIRSLGLASLAHKTPRQEIAAIAASPWASSHYGGPGGPNLQATFASLFGGSSSLDTPWQPPSSATGIAGAVGTGSAADAGSVDITGSGGGPSVAGAGKAVADAALGPIHSVEGLIKFVTSWRFAEIVGGFLLLIVGLVLLGRQLGVNVPAPGPFGRSASRAQAGADSTFAFEPGEQAHRARQASRRTSRQGSTSGGRKLHTLPADRPASPPRAAASAGGDEVPF